VFDAVVDSIYLRTSRSFDSNIMYINSGENHILVDTGTGLFSEEVDKDLQKLGSSLDKITDIILTHSHIDHIGGVAYLLDVASPKIHLHEAEAEPINAGDMRKTLADTFGTDLPEMKIEGLLQEGQLLDFGDVKMKVLHTPGHSSGSVCLHVEESNLIITGDTLFAGGSFGRVDFPDGSAELIVKSLKRLADIDFDIALPGHNQMIRHNAKRSAELSYQTAKSWFRV
jgi:glyoxylase-like metal-dependent hydrolase (beta-lactamase superfamily II)